jgi:amino acid transporter
MGYEARGLSLRPPKKFPRQSNDISKNNSMPRRSKLDREAERDAYRILMPVLFGGLSFMSYRLFTPLFPLAPWTQWVAVGFAVVLATVGLFQIPRAIRTLREL